MSRENDNRDNTKYPYLAYGTSFGLLGGAFAASIISLFIETPLIWAIAPGFGLLIGIIVGVIMDENKK